MAEQLPKTAAAVGQDCVCTVVVKDDVYEMLAPAEKPESQGAAAAIIEWLGNRDMDEMIGLYELIARAAAHKAKAWRQIKDSLEVLEELEARS